MLKGHLVDGCTASFGFMLTFDIESINQCQVKVVVPIQNGRLGRRSIGNCLVWVERLVQILLVKEIGHHVLYHRNPGRAAHQDNLVNFAPVDAGVLENTLERAHHLGEQALAQFLELLSGHSSVEVHLGKYLVQLNVSLLVR